MHADFPDRIVVARNGSPLIIGVGDKEMYVASDLAALVRYTTTVAHLDDGELATVTATGFTTFRQDLTATDRRPPRRSTSTRRTTTPGEHESYMHKEMLEQPEAAERVLRGRLDERFGTAHLGGLNMDARETRGDPAGEDPRLRLGLLRRPDGRRRCSRSWPGSRPTPRRRSEFRYRNPIIEPDTLYVAVSQSGETVDTLLAVQEIRRKGGRVIGLVNVVGSAIARECDGGIYLHAGPEVAVASTKALTTMFLGVRAARAAARPGPRPVDRRRQAADRRACTRLPDQIAEILDREDELAEVARAARARPRACSSSAGCAASRSRARARRSSRRSPTGTPRPTRPPSSSTARWR